MKSQLQAGKQLQEHRQWTERLYVDEEGRLCVALLFYEEECQHDDSCYGDVELLHVKGRKQLVGTEPQHKELLVFRQVAAADGYIQE